MKISQLILRLTQLQAAIGDATVVVRRRPTKATRNYNIEDGDIEDFFKSVKCVTSSPDIGDTDIDNGYAVILTSEEVNAKEKDAISNSNFEDEEDED